MVYSVAEREEGASVEMKWRFPGERARKQKEFVWVILILAGISGLAVALYKVSAPESSAKSFTPVMADGVQVALEGENRITSVEKNKLAWTMASKGLEYYQEKKEVRVVEPQAVIPLKEGGTVEVYGTRGVYFQASEDIGLSDEVSIILNRGGRQEWVLNGDTASYRRREEAFYISNLQGVISQAQGDTVGIWGEKGRYDIKTRSMVLAGDVVCRRGAGMTLFTDQLNYAVDSSVASTDSAIYIEGLGWKLRGKGLTANLKTQQVVVPAEVNITLTKGGGGKQ